MPANVHQILYLASSRQSIREFVWFRYLFARMVRNCCQLHSVPFADDLRSFCMYRLRTADKGRPLIVSNKIIAEYSDGVVDTLHKKNLLALGEDRYLTTLMTKHFPHMSYKFIPDAYANTAAPESWSVLLSQRRRWINSTVHNLAELMFLEEMCGFCFFSMRFVVFLDLFGGFSFQLNIA